ncbi:MAG: hypothetical protein KDA73_04270 [Rhodobacteraceae bacterium]|nr:hypothetical protein [Paracoccaceae bacterium]
MTESSPTRAPGPDRRLMELNAAWRAALIRTLDVCADTFQLLFGTTGADDAPHLLEQIADMVPEDAAVSVAPPQGSLRRSTEYGRLLNALAPETENGLCGVLGAAYPGWIRYRNAALPGSTQQSLFDAWSQRHLPAGRAQLARQHFAADTDALIRLRDAYWASQNRFPVVMPGIGLSLVPEYVGPREACTAPMFALRDGRIAFDSEAPDRMARTATWFRDTGRAAARMLPGFVAPAARLLESRIIAERITVTGRIGSRAVVPVTPGNWYDDQVVARAAAAERDEAVWDAWSSAGSWTSFFGPAGKLARHVSHLVMVGDIELDVVVHARFDATEIAAVSQLLPKGVWPFMASRGRSVGPDLRMVPHPEGKLQFRLTTTAPQCWGVLVEFAA